MYKNQWKFNENINQLVSDYLSSCSIGDAGDFDPRIARFNCTVVNCKLARPDCDLLTESCTQLAWRCTRLDESSRPAVHSRQLTYCTAWREHSASRAILHGCQLAYCTACWEPICMDFHQFPPISMKMHISDPTHWRGPGNPSLASPPHGGEMRRCRCLSLIYISKKSILPCSLTNVILLWIDCSSWLW